MQIKCWIKHNPTVKTKLFGCQIVKKTTHLWDFLTLSVMQFTQSLIPHRPKPFELVREPHIKKKPFQSNTLCIEFFPSQSPPSTGSGHHYSLISKLFTLHRQTVSSQHRSCHRSKSTSSSYCLPIALQLGFAIAFTRLYASCGFVLFFFCFAPAVCSTNH